MIVNPMKPQILLVSTLAWAITSRDANPAPDALAQVAPANPTLAALPPNTALDLGPYRCDASADVPHPCDAITDYSGFTYDAARHVMLMFGGGHASTFRDDVDVFRFDTLAWSAAYPTTACSAMREGNLDLDRMRWVSTDHPVSRHTYDQTVVAQNTGQLLLMTGGSGRGNCAPNVLTANGNDAFFAQGTIPSFDLDRLDWTFGAARPEWGYAAAAEYDPPSGRVVVLSQYGLWTYDPVTDRQVKHLDQFPADLGYANNLVYYPPDQRHYYIARGQPTRVFALSLDRGDWSASRLEEVKGASGQAPDSQESGWAYDPMSRVIGGGVKDGTFWAYDPLANHWATEAMRAQSPDGRAVGTVAFHALAFDPVDGVYLFITDAASGRRTWAYRWQAGAEGGMSPTPGASPTPTDPLSLPSLVRR